jgi:hypothetical protein
MPRIYVEYQKIIMAFDEKSFDEMAFGFDELVFDQVVDSIKMAFDEVVGRRGYKHSSHSNEQTTDDASVFCQILSWQFVREDLMTPADLSLRIMCGSEIIKSNFRIKLNAVMSGNPKIAAETLTKSVVLGGVSATLQIAWTYMRVRLFEQFQLIFNIFALIYIEVRLNEHYAVNRNIYVYKY